MSALTQPIYEPAEALVPYSPAPLPAALEKLARSHDEFLKNRRARSTRRLYASHWQSWQRWAAEHGLAADRPTADSVALYLRFLAEEGRKPATIQVHLAAVEFHLNDHGVSVCRDRMVRNTMAAIRREYRAERSPKQCVLAADIASMLEAQPQNLYGLRNQAVLLIGFLSAMRRSEITAIDVEHLEWNNEGLRIRIPSSKTDQTGEGQSVTILYMPQAPRCPVRTLDRYLKSARILAGPVFRPVDPRSGKVAPRRLSPETIADIVKTAAERIGRRSDIYAGHSLRSGFVTQSAINGEQLADIMTQTRHTDAKTCMKYIRNVESFKRNPGRNFWR
jgi:integrase